MQWRPRSASGPISQGQVPDRGCTEAGKDTEVARMTGIVDQRSRSESVTRAGTGEGAGAGRGEKIWIWGGTIEQDRHCFAKYGRQNRGEREQGEVRRDEKPQAVNLRPFGQSRALPPSAPLPQLEYRLYPSQQHHCPLHDSQNVTRIMRDFMKNRVDSTDSPDSGPETVGRQVLDYDADSTRPLF